MFTGIVTDIGTIAQLDQQGDLRARITTAYQTAGIDLGASIASGGVSRRMGRGGVFGHGCGFSSPAAVAARRVTARSGW